MGGAIVSSAHSHPSLAHHAAQVDWNQAGFDGGHSSHNPYEVILNASNVSKLSVVWTAEAGSDAILRAVAGGRVYTSVANRLVTFRAGDGAPSWTKAFPGTIVSVALFDGRVYVAANRGAGPDGVATLHALRAKDGACLWTRRLSGAAFAYIVASKHGLYTAVTYPKDRFYFNCRATISARNPVTGQPLWSRLGPPPFTEANFCFEAGPLSEHDGVVYARFPCTDRNCLSPLAAFSATTGAALWTAEDAKFSAVPVVAKGAVYLGGNWSYVGSVSSFSATDGATRWNWLAPDDFTGVSQPAATEGKLFVSWDGFSGIAELRALDASAGTDAWTQAGYYGKPTVANGLVYVAGTDLAAFTAATGDSVWTYALPADESFILSELIVVNGRVYILSSAGKVYAFGLTR